MQLNEIPKDSVKFERCTKALNEKNTVRPDGQQKIQLMSAFKIENKRLLAKFEGLKDSVSEGLPEGQSVLVKGLFIKIKKKELM